MNKLKTVWVIAIVLTVVFLAVYFTSPFEQPEPPKKISDKEVKKLYSNISPGIKKGYTIEINMETFNGSKNRTVAETNERYLSKNGDTTIYIDRGDSFIKRNNSIERFDGRVERPKMSKGRKILSSFNITPPNQTQTTANSSTAVRNSTIEKIFNTSSISNPYIEVNYTDGVLTNLYFTAETTKQNRRENISYRFSYRNTTEITQPSWVSEANTIYTEPSIQAIELSNGGIQISAQEPVTIQKISITSESSNRSYSRKPGIELKRGETRFIGIKNNQLNISRRYPGVGSNYSIFNVTATLENDEVVQQQIG